MGHFLSRAIHVAPACCKHRSWAAAIAAVAWVWMSAAAPASEIKTVGVIVADLGNPFFEQIARDVDAVASRLVGPSVKVIVRSSGYDLDRQIEQIDQMVKDKTDLLVLNAVDTDRIAPAVHRAVQAGVIVVAVDVRAVGAQATVTSDNIGAGKAACGYLAQKLKGKGDVLILSGPPVSSVIERAYGCRLTLAGFPDIHVLPDSDDGGGSLEGGLTYMTEAMSKYPHIDAVFAINDPTAIGADIAASRAGRNEFFIMSIDGSRHGVEVVKREGTRLIGTVVQNPLQMAQKAVALGVDLFERRPVTDGDLEIPVYLLTRENIGEYSGWKQ